MRIEQASKNIKYSTIAYTINNILKFIVRLIFVKSLPIEYLGINGLFTNLLAMLSLAELGIGPAIVYSLYKPLAEKDQETIKSLMYLFKKAYITIGIVIIITGICISPLLDWFIKDKDIVNIYWYYFIFLLNTGVSYFYSYKRNLIIADQKQYINSIYQSSGQILLALLQIASLMIYPNYFVFITLMLFVTIIENCAVARKAEQIYPYLQSNVIRTLDNEIKKTIIKNVKAMVAHKIGEMMVFSTSSLILSKYVGLIAVGLYSNYYLVISAINNFSGQFFASITASIGNMIAMEDETKKQKIFKVTEFIVAWQAMVVSCGFCILLNPLIELWLGKEFLFDELIINCIIVNFYLMYMRKAVLAFRDASGLYWNDRYKPLAEALINLFASVYLTVNYGVIGVVWGGIISILLTCFWVEPFILFRNSIKMKMKDYFKDYAKFVTVTFVIEIINKIIYSYLFIESNVIKFACGVLVSLIVSNFVWIVIFRNREELKYLKNILYNRVLK